MAGSTNDDILIVYFDTNWDTAIIAKPKFVNQKTKGLLKSTPTLHFNCNDNGPMQPATPSGDDYIVSYPVVITGWALSDSDTKKIKLQSQKLLVNYSKTLIGGVLTMTNRRNLEKKKNHKLILTATITQFEEMV